MTKNLSTSNNGDTTAPALRATEEALRLSADQASKIQAEKSRSSSASSSLVNFSAALKSTDSGRGNVKTCNRTLWASFFFDGTRNNMLADLALSKHSNIVRLYRAHKKTDLGSDRFVLYIPGIGTYFPEIGDKGGGSLGLGCGEKGEGRLDFAIKQLDIFLKKPLKDAMSSANSIREINFAAFGFSRGAALARAFFSMVMKDRCSFKNGMWTLTAGGWPVRFRFLGLFDTVASVGLTLSSNTTGAVEAISGDLKGMIFNRLKNYPETRPEALAFALRGAAGANPAPGPNNGHNDWGSRLAVHESVEEVRHLIAAHEVRNSFPVDSIARLVDGKIVKPSHFYEAIYPGAHSDVGGGYAAGEGAKSVRESESLSLIPLQHMYDYALRSGVPFLVEFSEENKLDFAVDESLLKCYDAYQKAVGNFSTIGDGILKHMRLYHAWRLRKIRRRQVDGRKEEELIRLQNRKFEKMDAEVRNEIKNLSKQEMMAQISLNAAIEAEKLGAESADDSYSKKSADVSHIEKAQEKYDAIRENRMRAHARQNSTPDMTKYHAVLSLYEQQLLNDMERIRAALGSVAGGNRAIRKRDELRPHYKALLEVYESEIERHDGLIDENVIMFFDKYVHDSLAGFARDATLPSDPRVVYLGGDVKYLYAALDQQLPHNQTDSRLA